MKPNGKRKPKKKKQPAQDVQAQIPHPENFLRAALPAAAAPRDAQREAIYRELTINHHPTQEDVQNARWAAEHGREARSMTMLSQQMGELGIAGHLPRSSSPPKAFSFTPPVNLGLGLPTAVRNPHYGMPPANGVRIYKNREERNWHTSDERSVQLMFVQEAQAQHYALAREGHELKVQHFARMKEKNRCQHDEWEMQLQMELQMIHMWHCPQHILWDQSPESCICCERGQANIDRLKQGIIANTMLVDQLDYDQEMANAHREKIDQATWNARLDAESAQGQLDYRVTSAGVFKEAHGDDSPYSTDRFEEDEKDPPGYDLDAPDFP